MYGQNDPAWRTTPLGSGPLTIGSNGCYLTSDADLMQWIGRGDLDPPTLNRYYVDHGIYVAGDMLADSALHDAFPEAWAAPDVYHCETVPCDQAQLDNDDPELYVIVELAGPNGGTHFAPVYDWRAWTVADPWTGQVKAIGDVGALFGWGTDPTVLVQKAVRLRHLTSPSPPPPPAPGTFTGVTCPDGVHVRVLPGTDQAIVPQPGANPDVVDAGTTLTFDGWCHHYAKGGTDVTPTDWWTGQPDDRWFRVQSTGHWIASSGIQGNPPADMQPVPDPAGPVPPNPPPPVPPDDGAEVWLDGLFVPSPDELVADCRALGCTGAFAYVARPGGVGNWTPAHVAALRAAGLKSSPIVVPPGQPDAGAIAYALAAAGQFGFTGGVISLDLEPPNMPPSDWEEQFDAAALAAGFADMDYGTSSNLGQYQPDDVNWKADWVQSGTLSPRPAWTQVGAWQFANGIEVNGHQYDASVVRLPQPPPPPAPPAPPPVPPDVAALDADLASTDVALAAASKAVADARRAFSALYPSAG